MLVGSKRPFVIALGPDHVPPASGVPPISSNKSIAEAVVQSVIDPGVPGSGFVTTLTTTSADADGQGDKPTTVYVYVPGVMVTASNKFPFSALGPLHVPPAAGLPPSSANSEVGGLVAHNAIAPSTPRFGGVLMVTVTEAVSDGQGAVPITV